MDTLLTDPAMQGPIKILAIAAPICIVAGVVWSLWRRAARIAANHESEAEAFERSVATDFSAPQPLTEAPHSLEASDRVGGDTTRVDAKHGGCDGKAAESSTPFVDSVIEKLRIAGKLHVIEGPLRTKEAGLFGCTLKLTDGRRIVVLETEPGEGDQEAEAMLRLFEGIIAPGPAGSPVFVRRFEEFLGDMFTL